MKIFMGEALQKPPKILKLFLKVCLKGQIKCVFSFLKQETCPPETCFDFIHNYIFIKSLCN